MTDTRRKRIPIVILALVLPVLILLSVAMGHYGVPVGEVVRILLAKVFPIQQTWTAQMAAAVFNIRLPRVLLACLVGCALSAAGTAYQTVFRNPMAAPDILGASSGACFGAALAILLGLPRFGIVVLAFGVSLASVGLVWAVGKRTHGSRIVNLLLAGIMVGSLFSAGTSYIKLVADPGDQLPAITYWMMGSLNGVDLKDVGFAVITMLIGLIPLLLLRWRINLLTVGEDEARSMGVNVSRLRLITVLCATVLTAAGVAVSGMIGWVGLVIPHLSRKLVGGDCRRLLPCSMLLGAVFLLLSDDVSRNLLTTEIPIGILTALIGAPFFLYLMTRKERAL